MSVLAGEPFVYVTRGASVESIHHVAAAVADSDGRLAYAMGDVETPVYLRSSAKPFIAAAVVASGAVERFGLDARELAVMAASHNGEPFHVAAVTSMLAKLGLGPGALQCGAHPPSYEPAADALAATGERPSALHNNCSGKHAGILAMCLALGFDACTYLDLKHPVQQRILAFCARACGADVADLPVGVDGCGIPVFATSLRSAARAFARMATLHGLEDADAAALERVRDAMIRHPAYVAGTERFDSALIETTAGRIVCKAGAEGVHADALRAPGLGLVLKVIDGSRRAAPPATLALLETLGALAPAERDALADFARADIRNVAGRSVGTISARVPEAAARP